MTIIVLRVSHVCIESSTRVGDYSPGVAPSLVSRSRLFNKELTKRNETGVVCMYNSRVDFSTITYRYGASEEGS
jgi:hypothetical protein